MDSFYLIVLGVAAMFLIIMLIFMGWMISHKSDQITTPSLSGAGMASMCPDYWEIDNDKCKIPQADSKQSNVGIMWGDSSGNFKYGANNGNTTIMNSGTTLLNTDESSWSGYMNKGLDPVCAKKMWANRWNIYWDGITNANYC